MNKNWSDYCWNGCYPEYYHLLTWAKARIRMNSRTQREMLRLLAAWDSEAKLWERAADKHTSVGEHFLANRCRDRAHEIARCRAQLKDVMQPEGEIATAASPNFV